MQSSVKSLPYGIKREPSALKLREMLVLGKTQQNRTAHISRTLSISSGKSPRETRISSGTAKAGWGFTKGLCAGVAELGNVCGACGQHSQTLTAAAAPAARVYLR